MEYPGGLDEFCVQTMLIALTAIKDANIFLKT
jgi:hypothetical protein